MKRWLARLRRPPAPANPEAGWDEPTLQAALDQALPRERGWLDEAGRRRHADQVRAFLARVRFIGCEGLSVSPRHRLTVAGLAALLVLRPQARGYPGLRSVLLYPGAFAVPQAEPDELGLVADEPVPHLGESWEGERVILSWADVEAALAGDPVNVAVHEFAHQLDDETPGAPGAPALDDPRLAARWAEVMSAEFARLRRHRRPPVLDPYGADSPAEFYGVVTEAFFQQPLRLRQHHAELYALLRDYYGFDPAPAEEAASASGLGASQPAARMPIS